MIALKLTVLKVNKLISDLTHLILSKTICWIKIGTHQRIAPLICYSN